MPEQIFTPQEVEQILGMEKSAEELYLDALEKKRDTLLAFHTMNSFRKGRSPEDMTPEEIEQYKALRDGWRSNKEKSMSVWDSLPEDKQQELTAMGSRLYDVQAKLTLLKLKEKPEPETRETTTGIPAAETGATEINTIPAQAAKESPETQAEETKKMTSEPPVVSEVEPPEKSESALELIERQSARADIKRREDINGRINEINKLLTEKYRSLREVSVIGRKPLEDEIRALENEKTRLEKELESPEGKVGKTWGDRIRNVFKRRKAEIAPVTESVTEQVETKPERTRQWTVLGWLAERGKGILSAGIWEVRQAWRFQRGTKTTARDLEAASQLIQVEDEAEGERIYNEIHDLMKENNITTVTAPEFMDIAKKVTGGKAAENNDRIKNTIKNSIDKLKEKVAKYRGQATAETVLTPENLKAVEADLRTQLNKMRDGATLKDVENFAKVMRDNMDKKWWLRYIYAPLEASLLGYLAYTYLPWSSWFRGVDIIPGGEDLPTQEAGQRYMDNNLWAESREQLKELGVNNPTNAEIQSVDSAAAQENNIRVVNPDTGQTLWPDTAGGQTKDISMMKGLIKWGAAHKTALAIKAARIVAGI
jgi:hypothetical protein